MPEFPHYSSILCGAGHLTTAPTPHRAWDKQSRFIALCSPLFLLALWWELRRWRERWASQWRWLITTQVRGLFVLLSFLNVISTGGNWERTERQNVIWANNKWLIYKKTNQQQQQPNKKNSWSCQNGTVKKNCKLNICGLFLSVVTVEGNKHSLVNTKNKFTKFSCHVFNIV